MLIAVKPLVTQDFSKSYNYTPTTPPRDDPPSSVIVEPFRGDWDFNANRDGGVSGESTGEDAIKGDLRKWIASSSVPILRSRGMTDEEIKSELLRDFVLTEEQVDEILQCGKYPKPHIFG